MNFKKIFSVLLVLSLVLSLGMLITSCGGDDSCTDHVDNDSNGKCDTCGADVGGDANDDKTEYSVIVMDVNNRAIPDVVLTLSTRNYTSSQITTNSDGKATASLKAVGYVKANIISVPEGYLVSTTEMQFEDDKTTLVISLAADTRVAHTITLVDNNGNAISGVLVQICEGGVCQTPVTTDANGKAVIRFNPSGEELKARVLNLPTGYERPGDVDDEGYIHVSAGTTEITLTLIAQ